MFCILYCREESFSNCKLPLSYFISLDIDECANDFHKCEQNCHNTAGSYECSCSTGFNLNKDGFTCDSKKNKHFFSLILPYKK